MISAGQLDKRISFEQRTATQDEIGQPVDAWATIGYAWASILYPSGLSAIRADADVAMIKVSIRIRYREDITEAFHIRYKNDRFAVRAVLPNRSKGYVDLVCEQVK